MNKEEKKELILELSVKITNNPNFYITDTSSLTVAKVNAIRRKCFEQGIEFRVAKNTLIRKALESVGTANGTDYSPLYDALKGSSTLMFAEKGNAPAKLIKEFRKTSDKPVLKGASVDYSFFIGDKELDTLINLKSKNELIGEVIGLLQSPAKNVISALLSGQNILAGLVKTLQERGE